MVITEGRSGKMVNMWTEKSKFSHLNNRHPGFSEMFPKTLEQSLKNIREKTGKSWDIHRCTVILWGSRT